MAYRYSYCLLKFLHKLQPVPAVAKWTTTATVGRHGLKIIVFEKDTAES